MTSDDLALMPCSATAAELQHDLSGTDPTPTMLARALDEVVSDVLSGQVIRFGRWHADIQSLLSEHMDEDDMADAFARLLVCSDDVLLDLRSALRDQIEATLRRELAGSELVQDVAARMQERDDD